MEALKWDELEALIDPEESTEEEREGFKVENDACAEWCLKQIADLYNERDRLCEACKSQIDFYQSKIAEYQRKSDNQASFFKTKLADYMRTVAAKQTKTQKSYVLPSGKLVEKLPSKGYEYDNEQLLSWLLENGQSDYVQVKESPMWGELKKVVEMQDGKVILKDTGEIIDVIRVVDKPGEFKVEIKK